MAGNDELNYRRLIAYLTLVLILLLAVLALDMTVGRQWASSVIGGGPAKESWVMYHEGGVRIGKWQIIRPPVKTRFIGYNIEQLSDGTTMPVLENNSWYEDGTKWFETKAYDLNGDETDFYPPDTPEATLARSAPLPLVVRREFSPDGTLLRETRWTNGVLVAP